MDNCKVNGYFQGMIVRGGTVNISNSTITNDYPSDEWLHYFDNKEWGSGNAVNLAALTIGNKSPNAYQYPASVTLTNTKVESLCKYPAVYMWGNEGEGLGASLVYDDATEIIGDIIAGNDACTVNGN